MLSKCCIVLSSCRVLGPADIIDSAFLLVKQMERCPNDIVTVNEVNARITGAGKDWPGGELTFWTDDPSNPQDGDGAVINCSKCLLCCYENLGAR